VNINKLQIIEHKEDEDDMTAMEPRMQENLEKREID
jgi:hypothetical protein